MRRWYELGICLLLLAATLGLYAQVYRFEFISLDDPVYVSDNPRVRAGLTVDGFYWALTTGSTGNWLPLTWLSYMVVSQLFGPGAGMQHLVNALLHAANSVLLFIVLDRMTGALWRSAFVAALFALHPTHVESVAWVAERKDVLSTLLALLTVWAYARYAVAPQPRRYLLVATALALGLAAKPMLVTLPFVLLLLDVWPLQRIALCAANRMAWSAAASTGWTMVREKLPLFVLVALASVVTVATQTAGGAMVDTQWLPFPLRLANALLAYVRYLGMTLWPRDLVFFYPYPAQILVWQVAAAALLLAGVSAVAFAAVRRRPYVAVGWFWYLGMLVPVIGLVQAGEQSLADRFTYLPSMGLFIIVAWGIPDILRRWRHRAAAMAGAAVGIITALMIVSWFQIGYWHDTITLGEHAVLIMPDNYLAHLALGMAYEEHGQSDAAMTHYAAALRINPNRWDTHNNYALLLAHNGRAQEAMQHYHEALRLQPDSPEAHYNLGIELAAQQQLDAAIAEYRAALRLNPEFAEAYYNLGTALAKQGKRAAAVAAFDNAVRIAQQAIAATRATGNPQLVDKLTERLQLYESEQRLQQTR